MSVEAGRRAATYRLVERSVGAYARIDAMVDTARHAARLFADGLLGAALDADEAWDAAARACTPRQRRLTAPTRATADR